MPTARLPDLPGYAFPNLVPVRHPLPADFKLVPDLGASRSVPVVPVMPPTVATGDLITAVHENTVTTALNNLWTDIQSLDATKISDPTTAAGDLMVRGASAIVALPVGAAGTLLMADAAQPTKMRWGTVVNAGGVPATRTLTAGTGLTGGGDLSADRSFAVVPDTINQRVAVYSAGALIGTRRAINFVAGANVTATVTDDTPNNRVNVTLAATFSQTPWTQNIDAAAWNLNNVGAIGVGSPAGTPGIFVGRNNTPYPLIWASDTATNGSARIQVTNDAGKGISLTAPGSLIGTTAQRSHGIVGASNDLICCTGATQVEAMRILGSNQYVGIGTATPGGPLDMIGASQPSTFADAGVGMLRIGLGPLATDDALLFGVHIGDYSWIQAVKAGTATRNLCLQVSGSAVGIGTTTINAGCKLAVVGGDIDLAEQVNGRGIGFFINGSGGRFADAASGLNLARYGATYLGNTRGFSVAHSGWGGLRFYTGDLERLSILNDGTVGIGIPNPSAAIHFRSARTDKLIIDNTDNNYSNTGSYLRISMSAGSGNVTTSLESFNNGGSASGALAFNPLGGNVGIGMYNPAFRFHVAGVGIVEGTGANVFTPSANPASSICITDNNGAQMAGGAICFGVGVQQHCAIRSCFLDGTGSGLGDLVFYTRAASASPYLTEGLRLIWNGGISIARMLLTAPAAGQHTLWADPADGYRVKFVP